MTGPGPAACTSRRLTFAVGGVRCAAWLTLPGGDGPHPGVVLVHGLGATHDMMLPQYEQAFAAAGIATFAFDYRYTGASEGMPRQHISMRAQRADVAAALDVLTAQPEVDATRIGLWGTSLGSMHVVHVAAERTDLSVAVVQCPIVHGPGAARRLGVKGPLRLLPAMAADVQRALTGRGRRYVPIVGLPGDRAMVTAPGAAAGWNSTVPPGGSFDNRIAAADAAAMVAVSAVRKARRVSVPLLVCVSDRENLMHSKHAVRVANRAPRGVARHYDSDHFEVYHPPLLAKVLGDQLDFLQEHLNVRP